MALLGVFVVLILAAQTLMPFAIVNRLIEEFNTNGISSVLRADNILDVQLSTTDSVFGLSEYQRQCLKENNIYSASFEYVNSSSAGSGGWALAYEVSPNVYNVVVAEHVKTSGQDASGVSSLAAIMSGANFRTVLSAKEALSDGLFKTPYTTASKTWRGGNSGWFDQVAATAEAVHGYSRSRWFSYGAKKAADRTGDLFKRLARLASLNDPNIGTADFDTVTTTTSYEGDEGEVITRTSQDPRGELTAKLGLAQKFVNAASAGADLACMAVEGFLSIQTLISTYQRLQKLNFVSGFMEAVQKVQAGDGTDSPMNDYSNNLVATDPDTGRNAISGMGSLFSGDNIDANNPAAQAANPENVMKQVSESQDSDIMALFTSVARDGRGLIAAYKTCNYVRGTLAIADAALTIASAIPLIGAGIQAFSLTFKSVAKAIAVTALQLAVDIIVPIVFDRLGKTLVEDVATEWVGEALGHILVSGGNSLLSANHQTGGGSPGSAATVAAFRHEQDRIIAEEADYQRSIRSPFDMSSQYTFLGSIVYSLIPMANSSGVGSVVKNMGTLVKNSVTSLLPTASAVAETNMVGLASAGDCPTLESIGIQGDAYCNPIYITDNSTIDIDMYTPEQIINIEKNWGFVTEENGVLHISDANEVREPVSGNKRNNTLRKYMIYCGQRVSSWGVADANIARSIQEKEAPSGFLSKLPLISNIVEVAKAAINIENLPWTTGSACVASADNEYWCELKFHQRFLEDTRVFDTTNNRTSSPIAEFYDNYYTQNPLDNSFEGVLARYSGMTKDDVIATLDLMEGLTYLAEYHPDTRLAFGFSTEQPALKLDTPDTQVPSHNPVSPEPKYIAYCSTLARNFAIA